MPKPSSYNWVDEKNIFHERLCNFSLRRHYKSGLDCYVACLLTLNNLTIYDNSFFLFMFLIIYACQGGRISFLSMDNLLTPKGSDIYGGEGCIDSSNKIRFFLGTKFCISIYGRIATLWPNVWPMCKIGSQCFGQNKSCP